MKLVLKRVDTPFVLELTNESGNVCTMDANPVIGGKGKGFRPMELLAGALAGCTSMDVINILTKKRIEIKSYDIDISAVRNESSLADFQSIHMRFLLESSVEKESVEKIIEMTLEKYCSVAGSLKDAIRITYEVEFI